MTLPYNQICVSICIVTFRRPELLSMCLDSLTPQLQKLNPCHFEVIVSDDCPNRSAYECVSRFGFAKWIQGPTRGVAANRNHISKAATGNWIIFIDDDEIAADNWLQNMFDAISSQRWDVIEGKVVPLGFFDNILWYSPSISSGGAYCTANLAIRKDFFFKLGGFNDALSVSHEDIEMGVRIRSCKPRSLYLANAVVFHPARRATLLEVCNRMVSLQYQSYLIKRRNYHGWYRQLTFLISFTLKYWFRVIRLELAARQVGQWVRPLQLSFLLFFTIPLGFFRSVLCCISFPPDDQKL